MKRSRFKTFENTEFHFTSLEVIVGTNGSGKSTLFEFLKFLRDAVDREIPPEIIRHNPGQEIFHLKKNVNSSKPGSSPSEFSWELKIQNKEKLTTNEYVYLGKLSGPVGKPCIQNESLTDSFWKKPYLNMIKGQGTVTDLIKQQKLASHSPENIQVPINRLTLGTITDLDLIHLYSLRKYILTWRFYSGIQINNEKIRRPVLIEQNPILNEDAGNLSSVLHYLMTEHSQIFLEIQEHLKSVIPRFIGLNVKARGTPGEVIAFYKESGIHDEMSLANLSDGILRLICWITLCCQPEPPRLICLDEPDQGIHPRALALLAGLFEKASEKTQLLMATHNSYFLTLFKLENIAVMTKKNAQVVFLKPKNSLLKIFWDN